jgi:hypothetical protein
MKRRNFLMMGTAMTAGCAWGSNIDVAEWTEEVKLSDGRMITVWRRARAYSGGFPNSRRGRDIDFEFKYESLGIYWKSNWARRPMSFDIIDGVPYMVVFISDRELCHGRPGTDYAARFLVWHHGQWHDIDQSVFPVGRAIVNLSVSYRGYSAEDDYSGLIAWKNKELPGGFNDKNPDTVKQYFERGRRFCESLTH